MFSGEEDAVEGPREPVAERGWKLRVEERIAATRPCFLFPAQRGPCHEFAVLQVEPRELADDPRRPLRDEHVACRRARAATGEQNTTGRFTDLPAGPHQLRVQDATGNLLEVTITIEDRYRPRWFLATFAPGGTPVRVDLHGRDYAGGTTELAGTGPEAAGERDAAIRAGLERYVATLEALCREAPYNWFNFYDFWSHADKSP